MWKICVPPFWLQTIVPATVMVIATLALCCACASAVSHHGGRRTPWHALEGYSFEDYEREFGKVYASPEERVQRRAEFERRLAKIRAHNADPSRTWKEGVNHLTDHFEHEIRRMLGHKPSSRSSAQLGQEDHQHLLEYAKEKVAAPIIVDWREHGIVSPVKDQGHCGSCWTFATTETIESHWAKKTGQLPILSEQQILDCTPNPNECGGTGGCRGGTTELAMDRIVNMGGLASEWTYPYRSYFGDDFPQCNFSTSRTPPAAKIRGYKRVAKNSYLGLMEALREGPVSISVDASAWANYETGIFNGCNQSHPDINHAVQLVGYGIDGERRAYWIVRNSWSPAWGEAGYIRLAEYSTPLCGIDLHPGDGTSCKGDPPTQLVCGTCGILFDNTYPIL